MEQDDLVRALEDAVAEMEWLVASDGALVALARSYAEAIDVARADDDRYALTRALYLGPHLLKALDTLGGTPKGRAGVKTALAEAKAATTPKAPKRSGLASVSDVPRAG